MSIVSVFINSADVTSAAPAVGFQSVGNIKAVQAITRVHKPHSIVTRSQRQVQNRYGNAYDRTGRFSKRDVKF